MMLYLSVKRQFSETIKHKRVVVMAPWGRGHLVFHISHRCSDKRGLVRRRFSAVSSEAVPAGVRLYEHDDYSQISQISQIGQISQMR